MTSLSRSTLSKAIVSSFLLLVGSSTYAAEALKPISSSSVDAVMIDEAAVKKETKAAQPTEKVETKEEKEINQNTSSGEAQTVDSIPYSEECDEDDGVDLRIGNNSRDGFFLGLSAISSIGNDFSMPDIDEEDANFDYDIAYRIQLASLFIESPGLSSRRIHGMYSLPAWGINFYDNEDWSFDLFYQYSTRGSKGLEGIQLRNEDERAGLRISGYLTNSQVEFIYSPISRNNEGSDGIETSLSYGYNGQLRNWTYYANVGVQYRSKGVTPYHGYGYGELPTDIDEGTSAGISYNVRAGLEYPLTTDWVFSSFVAYHALSDRSVAYREAYAENVTEGSVDSGYRAGLSLSYVF